MICAVVNHSVIARARVEDLDLSLTKEREQKLQSCQQATVQDTPHPFPISNLSKDAPPLLAAQHRMGRTVFCAKWHMSLAVMCPIGSMPGFQEIFPS